MSKEKKKVVGKVGYCTNRALGIRNRDGNYVGGDYVYIRKLKNGKRDVNIITSLEDAQRAVYPDKINKVRRGYLYSIPVTDSNFTRWSAVNLDGNINNIPLSAIQDIGKKGFKKRHRFFIGKFTR